MYVCAKLLQLCLTLYEPVDCSPLVCSVHGISQVRVLECVACPPPGNLLDTVMEPASLTSPALAGGFFTTSTTWEAPLYSIRHSVQFSSVTQSCPTLCDPMNHSTPGLPVHHHLPEFTQTHVHRVRDAIQPSHPLSSPSPPAPNPSQHQSLFQ